jgi:hypothetical protein
MRARWDGDTRGHGVGDAGQLVAGANDLITAFTQTGWVTEQPENHLLPHIEAWCHQDQRLSVTGTSIDNRNAYIVNLEWRGASVGVGQARAAIFALIGSFAETATYVRQRREARTDHDSGGKLQFEVGTGEVAPDSRFLPHGHVVVINLAGVL